MATAELLKMKDVDAVEIHTSGRYKFHGKQAQFILGLLNLIQVRAITGCVSKNTLMFCRQTHLFGELWDELVDSIRYLRLVAVSGEPFATVTEYVFSMKSLG